MAVVANPILLLIKNSLAAIALRTIRENGDDTLSGTEAFSNPVRRGGCRTRRPAAKEPFKPGDLLQCRTNFIVLDHHDLIGQRRIVDLGNKITLANAFDLLWSRWSTTINRSFGLHQDTKHVVVMLPDCPRDTAKRARGSCADHDRIYLAVHLLYNLTRGREIMKTRVRIILKLLGHKAVVDGPGQFVAAVDRALHTRFVRHVLNFAAEGFNKLHFFLGKASRDAEDNTVTPRNSHQREPDSSVSRSGLDNRRAGFEQASVFGVANHPQRRAIFDGSAGIKPFDLCVNTGKGWLSKSGKMKEGSLAYEIENAFCDAERHESDGSTRYVIRRLHRNIRRNLWMISSSALSRIEIF